MTPESSEPQISSEGALESANTEKQEATLPVEPTLNRADRRALAQKKKPIGGNGGHGTSYGNSAGAANRGNFVGKTRIPRTGHK